MPLRAEFEEFVTKAKEAAADGRWTADEIHVVIREGIDVIGPVLDALDPNDSAAVDALIADVQEAAAKAIDALPSGRLGMKPMVKMAAEYAVPSFVRAVCKAGVPVSVWIEQNLLPRVTNLETTFHHLRVTLGG